MVKIQTEQVLLGMLGCSLHLPPGVCLPEADSVSELLSFSLPHRSPSLPFSASLPALLVITHPSLNCLYAFFSFCPLQTLRVPLLLTSPSLSLLLPSLQLCLLQLVGPCGNRKSPTSETSFHKLQQSRQDGAAGKIQHPWGWGLDLPPSGCAHAHRLRRVCVYPAFPPPPSPHNRLRRQ